MSASHKITNLTSNEDRPDFLDLEAPVCDTAMATQILATLFEDAESGVDLSKEPISLYKTEADQIRFMIYDLCGRTKRLQKDFYAACATEKQRNSGAVS